MKGFVKLRRGILEHLERGDLDFYDLGVYVTIHMQADFTTGIWLGSAAKLTAVCPHWGGLRDVQKALRRLEEKGYIKRFRVAGLRSNYRVAIDKFEIESGELKGCRLNAGESMDWRRPKYERGTDLVTDPVTDVVTDRVTDPCSDPAPVLELRSKNEKKENPKAAPAALVIPEWIPAKTWEAFLEMRTKCPPTPYACVLIFNKLRKFMQDGQSPKDVLDQSIENGWKSLFPIREDRNGQSRQGVQDGGFKNKARQRTEANAAALARVLGSPTTGNALDLPDTRDRLGRNDDCRLLGSPARSPD